MSALITKESEVNQIKSTEQVDEIKRCRQIIGTLNREPNGIQDYCANLLKVLVYFQSKQLIGIG